MAVDEKQYFCTRCLSEVNKIITWQRFVCAGRDKAAGCWLEAWEGSFSSSLVWSTLWEQLPGRRDVQTKQWHGPMSRTNLLISHKGGKCRSRREGEGYIVSESVICPWHWWSAIALSVPPRVSARICIFVCVCVLISVFTYLYMSAFWGLNQRSSFLPPSSPFIHIHIYSHKHTHTHKHILHEDFCWSCPWSGSRETPFRSIPSPQNPLLLLCSIPVPAASHSSMPGIVSKD